MTELINELKKMNLGKMIVDASLKDYTTYKIGGIARLIIYPKNIECLTILIKKLKANNIKFMVLGNGSNVLFSDEVYEGVIIKLDEFNQIEFQGSKVIAGSGASLMKVAYQSIRRGLTGLEFATGIPGSIGGAIYMNAGAYKSDMGYVVSKIKVLTPKMTIITMVNRELDFHYRTSFLKNHKDYICLEATINLQKGDKEAIEQVVLDRKKRRLESQPLEYPSAGSVFRNPKDMFAGKLIEDLGYKGLVKGGAKVSEKHANFIINFDHAKATDVKELIDFLKQVVKEKYNVDLLVEQEFINWE
jgi:UDP-N-acetylmuramate dehydrogenase